MAFLRNSDPADRLILQGRGVVLRPPEGVDFAEWAELRARSRAEKAVIARHVSRKIWPAVLAERIKPIIHKVYPLAEAAAAHRDLESREVVGKVVLITDKYEMF